MRLSTLSLCLALAAAPAWGAEPEWQEVLQGPAPKVLVNLASLKERVKSEVIRFWWKQTYPAPNAALARDGVPYQAVDQLLDVDCKLGTYRVRHTTYINPTGPLLFFPMESELPMEALPEEESPLKAAVAFACAYKPMAEPDGQEPAPVGEATPTAETPATAPAPESEASTEAPLLDSAKEPTPTP